MGGRYGGDINRPGRKKGWRVAREVLDAIGRNARPDLEAVGRRIRRVKLPKPVLPDPAQGLSR